MGGLRARRMGGGQKTAIGISFLRGDAWSCETLGIDPPCPDEMIGSLAAIPLSPGSPEPPTSALYADPLQERLLRGWGIEVPIIPWPAPPERLIRISAQLYNRIENYEFLASALKNIFNDEEPGVPSSEETPNQEG